MNAVRPTHTHTLYNYSFNEFVEFSAHLINPVAFSFITKTR